VTVGESVDTDRGAGRVPGFLAQLAEWAARCDDVVGVALVGSHARGTARPNSDVDVVILAEDPRRYLDDTARVTHFGEASPAAVKHEER
jgi:hypothetical protein